MKSARIPIAAMAIAVLTGSIAPELQAAVNGAPAAAFTAPVRNERIAIDFNNVDVRVVIRFFSKVTGKNIIIDDNVKGSVTLVSPSDISIDDAWPVFLSVLETMGFSAVESSALIKIVPEKEASTRNRIIRIGCDPDTIPVTDDVVTQIMPLTYVSAANVAALLQPLASRQGSMVVYHPSNTLVVTDTSSAIHKYARIIRTIDVKEAKVETAVIPVVNASVEVLAEELNAALTVIMKNRAPGSRTGRRMTVGQNDIEIIPNRRTNSLIAVASTRDIVIIRDLVKSLDIEKPENTDRIHTYYLKNARAESVAQVLVSLLAEKGSEERVNVTADKLTNSLIITSSPQDFKTLKKIVDTLDVVQDQVLVEMLIAEVSDDLIRKIGVQWSVAPEVTGSGDFKSFQGQSFGEDGSLKDALTRMGTQAAAGWSGLGVGLMKGDLASSGIAEIAAAIQAYAMDTDVNILSTPHLIAGNNEEAEIIIGENIPFVKDSRITESDPGNPTVIKTYDYKDIGIHLKLTPHISPDGFIKMDIYQQVTDLIGNLSETPTTTKRETTTTVRVKNDQTVVIGGLTKDNKVGITSKVPILGDIPLLGLLFRRKDTTTKRTNLLVFITPHIVTDSESVDAMTARKRKERERFLEAIGKKDMLAEREKNHDGR